MRVEIKSLTALRGIAALMVVIYHLEHPFYPVSHAIHSYTSLFTSGYLWVDFFFVLSGFVMTYVYGEAFKNAPNWSTYVDFIKKRLVRIYPVHIFMLFVFLAMRFVFSQLEAGSYPLFNDIDNPYTFVLNIFLIQSWKTAPYLSWNGPSWSISVEWAAYLLFPIGLWILATWRWSLALLALLAGFGLLVALNVWRGTLDIHWDYGVLRALPSFGAGILIARLRDVWVADHGPGFLGSNAVALSAFALLLVSLHLGMPDVVSVAAATFVVGAFAFNESARGGNTVARWLSVGPLYYLGLISYSLYMIHWFWITLGKFVLSYYVTIEGTVGERLLIQACLLAATLASAPLLYHFIERPARNVLRRRLGTKPTPIRVASASSAT